MMERYSDGLTPNYVPIPIFADGLLEGGHSRVKAAQTAGITWVWVVFTDSEYPDEHHSFDNAWSLINHNLQVRVRGYETVLNEYLTLEETWFEQHGAKWPPQERLKAIDALNTGTKFAFGLNTVNKLKLIKATDPQLLKEMDDGEITLSQAMTLVKGPAEKLLADPDRHNFHDDFRKYPSIRRYITKQPFDMFRAVLKATNNIMLDAVAGWEKQFIGSLLSNLIMSALVEAYNKTGVKKLRATSAGSDETERKKQYEDVGFPVLDELADKRLNTPLHKYFPTNIEIKVSRWKDNCSATIFEANWAIRKKPAQEYIMTCYTPQLNKFVMMLVTIDGKDWTRSGKQARITLTKLQQLNPTYLIGELFEGKGDKVEVQWEDAYL